MRFGRLTSVALLLSMPLHAADDTGGHVQIPVDAYTRLIEASRGPRPAPAGYALGNARVSVSVRSADGHASAETKVELEIQVLDDQWVLVPILPAGTAVEAATVGGAPVQLAATPSGLAWVTNKKGAYTMSLSYRADALRSPSGFALALPVPAAAAIRLTAVLPGKGLEPTVIPAAGARITSTGNATQLEATIPTTSAVQLAWRTSAARGPVVSRAHYVGRLVGEAIVWSAELGVDLAEGESATVPLLPKELTLSTLVVDGREAPILLERGRYATVVSGAGTHAVKLGFETPVVRADGPPHVEMKLPPIPISRLDLTLPGNKELKVTPASNVTRTTAGGTTQATAYVGMGDTVSLEWSEAIPEEIKAEVAASAALHHVVRAEEGVLYIHARIQYDISRGATNKIRLLVPAGVQVNKIEAGGASVDWRLSPAVAGQPRIATLFLDRDVSGELALDVDFDRALGRPGEDLEVPLLRAADAQRERGMVALVATSELTLDPREDAALVRVGENQLPAPVRETIHAQVAHTFKYADAPPRLHVRARTPDPVVAHFDTQVDTLVSLGEGAVSVSAGAEVHVKAGRLTRLLVELPPDVNLLSLTGPSLRGHTESAEAGRIVSELAFTQEMEGEFRLELVYERILGADESQLEVRGPRVRGADVEQGRIAVEALSAVEVRPAAAPQLSPVDVAELPQQLVLRTTHPILMAYKYQRAEQPGLTLSLTRHKPAGVQEAAIDRADYRTLLTRDGLSVTSVEFTLRNTRKQFLRLRLPRGAAVWSAFVDGRPEKPAVADEPGGTAVLIKIVSSTAGFPVQVVYATQGSRLSILGRAQDVLARPDVLVTQARWDLYLPAALSYGRPATNMDLRSAGEAVSREAITQKLARADAARGTQALDPLVIAVPASGVHFAFEKLYPNQADQDGWVAIRYASAAGAFAARVASALGAALFWLGLAGFFGWDPRLTAFPRRRLQAAMATGIVIVLACAFVYDLGQVPALLVSLGVGAAALARLGGRGRAPLLADTPAGA